MKVNLIHWYKKNYKVWLIVFLALLMGDVIIDPNNSILNIKYVLFGMIFIIWMPKMTYRKLVIPKELVILVLFISFFMPFYALSLGFLNNFIQNTEIGTIIYFNSFFFFLLVIIIIEEKIDLTSFVNFSAFLIVLITIGSYFILVFNTSFYLDLVQYLVIDKGVAIYMLRDYGDFTILMLYYKTSPLLIFPLSYYLHQLLIQKRRDRLFIKIAFIISLIITLFLSGTRANLVVLFLILIFYLGYFLYKNTKALFILFCFLGGLFSIYGISIVTGLLFNPYEESNMVKYGHLVSYFEYFSNNSLQFIFGQGLGGSFYSSGFNTYTNTTELTYFEMVRVWGLPITFLFLFILMIPIYYEIKTKKITPIIIAYIAYLFIAGTNPFLLSSTGMIVLVYVFSDTFLNKKNPKEQNTKF